MGYRPDPAMQVLIERRWRGRRSDDGFNIAYFYDSAGHYAQESSGQFKRFKESSRNLGYNLIAIDLREFANVHKLIHRLEAQGVSGVVFSIMPATPYDIRDVCDRFAAVSINVSHVHPNCPIIMHDEFRSIEQVWKQLESLGYQRFGVILEDYQESFSMDQRLGAVYCRQRLIKPAKNCIPIHFFERKNPDRAELCKWLERYQPDVVLGDTHHELEMLRDFGWKVPEDFAFATVNLWDPKGVGDIAGYFRDNVRLFERGLQLLNLMVRSGATGASQGQLVEMVKGVWQNGGSLPKLVDAV